MRTKILKVLWPNEIINSKTVEEKNVVDIVNNVRAVTELKNPYLTVFPADSKEKSPAVLIFPGGGYSFLTIDKEGTEIAEWLNKIGVTAVLVNYRVPNDRNGAFQDARRAMRLVRYNADNWNIKSNSIGALGFSAGGHLAAKLCFNCDENNYEFVDDADKFNCYPDFCILIYPAYLVNNKTHKLSEEVKISENTPPTFIVHTEDDEECVPSSIGYYKALKEAGITSEFQLFKDGGHGYGLRPSKYEVSKWPVHCEKWLTKNNFIS